MYDENYLMHHGVKGMKWGVRRYRNYDGSLTSAGRAQRRSEYRNGGSGRGGGGSRGGSSGGRRRGSKRNKTLETAAKVAGAAALAGAGAYALKKSGAADKIAGAARRNATLQNLNAARKAGMNSAANSRAGQAIGRGVAKVSNSRVGEGAKAAGRVARGMSKLGVARAGQGLNSAKNAVSNSRVGEGAKAAGRVVRGMSKLGVARAGQGLNAAKNAVSNSRAGQAVNKGVTKIRKSGAAARFRGARVAAGVKASEARDRFNKTAGAKLRGARVAAGVKASEARDRFNKTAGAKLRGARVAAGVKASEARDRFNKTTGAKLRGARVAASINASDARSKLANSRVGKAASNGLNAVKDAARTGRDNLRISGVRGTAKAAASGAKRRATNTASRVATGARDTASRVRDAARTGSDNLRISGVRGTASSAATRAGQRISNSRVGEGAKAAGRVARGMSKLGADRVATGARNTVSRVSTGARNARNNASTNFRKAVDRGTHEMEKRAARRSTPEARLRRSGNIVDLNKRTSLKDRAASAANFVRSGAKAARLMNTKQGRKEIADRTERANSRTIWRKQNEALERAGERLSRLNEGSSGKTLNEERYGSRTVRQAKQKGKKSKRR